LEVEEKDQMRNFQPPISGEEVMQAFNLEPSKIVGEIKEEIKEAILEGRIHNNPNEARELMIQIAKKKGLDPVNNP
jgi:poly(A) polymerase